jgi:tetratricopeptide (TPR) repeat protein
MKPSALESIEAESLMRLACVPECWQALRKPQVAQIAAERGIRTPAELIDAGSDLNDGTGTSGDTTSVLLDISRAADRLADLGTGSTASLVGVVEADPIGVRSALACAADRLGDDAWLSPLLQSQDPEIRRSALIALICNFSIDEVLSRVRAAIEEDPVQLSQDFAELGQIQLASMLLKNAAPAVPDDVAMEMKAQRLALEGDREAASTMLEGAWEASTSRTADLAEQMAELASEAGEALVALQARERAHAISPTTLRAAELARACVDFGQPARALEDLGESPTSKQGWIARGQALIALDRIGEARAALDQAAALDAEISTSWTRGFAQARRALGETGVALNLTLAAIGRRPLDMSLRRLLVELALAGGEYDVAAQEATLLVALSPEATQPRELLAQALEASGDAATALPHRLVLAEQGPEAKAAAVDCSLKAGDPATGLSLAQELVQEQPNTALARVALGRALVRAGNSRGGLVHLRKATELDASQASTWLARSQVELELGEFERAGETLAQAIEACPTDADIHLAYANWLAESENWTVADASVGEALALDPENAEAMVLQGRIFKALGRAEKARKSFEQAHSRKPGDWQLRADLAQMVEAEGDHVRALTLLEGLPEAIPAPVHALVGRVTLKSIRGGSGGEHDPGIALQHLLQAKQADLEDPEIDFWMGEAYAALGETSQALQCYQSCLKSLPPGAAEIRQACVQGEAEAAMSSGQIPLAISVLERANEAVGLDSKSLSMLSRAYAVAGLFEEALPPALQACEMDPTDEEAKDQAVTAALAAGRADAVIEIVDDWSTRHPDNPKHHFRMADVFRQLGNITASRSSLARALMQVRRDACSLGEAAGQLAELGEVQRAKRLLQRAQIIAPDDLGIMGQLGRIAAEAEDHRLAHYAWKSLLDREPESLEGTLGIADALWHQEQRAAAIGALQRAVNLAPERADLHTRLARAQVENGEIQHALEHYRIASASSPDNAQIQRESARAFLDAGAADEAADILKRPQKESTSSASVRLKAEVEITRGNMQAARALLLKIPEGERDATIEALLAWALHASGEPEEADHHLSRALTQADGSPDSAFWVARVAMTHGHWNEAARCLEALKAFGTAGALFAFIVRARLADAFRLFGQVARSPELAPAKKLAQGDALKECLRTLDDLSPSVTGSERSAMRARALAAFGASAPNESFDIANLPRHRLMRDHASESRAIDFMIAGSPMEALQVLSEATDEARSSEWSSLLAGLAHLQSNQMSPARKAFGIAAEDPLQKPVATFLTGLSFAGEGRISEGINAINSAVLSRPSETGWQVELAQLYLRQGQPDSALPHLQQACENDPRNLEIQAKLARALSHSGQISEAAKVYEGVVASSTQDVAVLLEAARSILAAGSASRALEILNQVLEQEPQHGEALAVSALAALRSGDKKAAESFARKARGFSPEDPEILLSVGKVLHECGQHQQALAILSDARQLAPGSNPSMEKEHARILLAAGAPENAISALEALLESTPGDDGAWALLADAYATSSRPEDAVDALRKALEIRPGAVDYRLLLSRLFRQFGQLDQALAELSALETEAPSDARIPFEIALVHKSRRQLDKSLSALQRSISIRGDIPSAHFEAGIILKSLKAYQHAAECFERVVELDPSDAEAHHQLAAVQALALVHGGMESMAVAT